MLSRQTLNLNFAQGLDTKTDPFQVQPGKFLSLQNSIFDKNGRLTKRNGFGPLTTLVDSSSTFLTTYNQNLTAIGDTLQAYSQPTNTWVTKGIFQPMEVNTLPLIRSNLNQSQADSVVATNGLVCTVYTDNPASGPVYKYVVADSTTGQNIVAPTTIPAASGGTLVGSPRVFLLGAHFVIVFTNDISGAYHLQYIAISVLNPTVVKAPADIATAYIPFTTLSWDGVVLNQNLYIAYNTTSGGQAVKVTYLPATLAAVPTATTFAGDQAAIISVTADTTANIVYASFYDSTYEAGYSVAVDTQLNKRMTPTALPSTGSTVQNITSTAINGVLTVYTELYNTYSYNDINGIEEQTDYITTSTVVLPATVTTGTMTSNGVLIRSLGLASKAFLINGVSYFTGIYSGPSSATYAINQPTYFIVNQSGETVTKLAYSNGGDYYQVGLPSAIVNANNTVQFAYLYKDLVASVNKTQGAVASAAIYSQLGINLASITFETKGPASEIGSTLNLGAGFVWSYDGYSLVEQGFHLWPDNVAATWTEDSIQTPHGLFTSGSTSIVVDSATGIYPGMTVTDTHSGHTTYIPAGTTVVSISGTTMIISQPTTGSSVSSPGDALSIQGNIASQSTTTDAYFYQVTYEWSDNQGNINRSAPSIPVSVTTSGSVTTGIITLNIPTLRVTAKTANPVKIVIYRWSVGQQSYYQVTSIQMPTLNNTTVDSITFVDTLPDSQIVGNNLIYTNGGVLEDIGAPATSLMALFDDRLWLVDAEDQNLLWFSKQVIEATPVEMSDLLTIYVAPTTSAQTSTGVITALSPMDDKLVIFKDNAIGYINGIGPDNTGANSQYSPFTIITSVVGCAIPNSIVLTQFGLMFQSNQGIWIVGRDLSTQYIGAPVESLTTGATVLSAINIPSTTQVRFTLDSGITLMYDYFYQQWGSFVNIPATSSTVYQGLHTYLNSYGQVFQETPGKYLDNSSPTLMSFTTSWLNLAGVQGFERFYHFYLLGQFITPFKLNVQIAYDYNSSATQNVIVKPDNYGAPWGVSPSLWGGPPNWGGTPGNGWEATSNVFEARVFPQRQKCESFQLTINELSDPAYPNSAGAGLTLSGLNIVAGLKRGFRTSKASRNFG